MKTVVGFVNGLTGVLVAVLGLGIVGGIVWALSNSFVML